MRGKVVRGFQRGSRQLGFPTANLDPSEIKEAMKQLKIGIYAGFAAVGEEVARPMVLSVGWNPQFHDDKKQIYVEAHIMHDYGRDFYGEGLSVLVLARIRDELKFESVDQLIQEIQNDVDFAAAGLDPLAATAARDPLFAAAATKRSKL